LTSPEFPLPIIKLSRSTVARLSQEVRRGFNSAHGKEVGGLLLGTLAPETGGIDIQDFEPLEWKGRARQFALSESECRALQSTLATSAWLRNGNLRVVGCYRSHCGEGFCLSTDDLRFAQRCLAGPSRVFLQIKASGSGALDATFFFWGDRPADLLGFQAFPFDIGQLEDEPAEASGGLDR
jgi:hypothetical protein